MKKTNWIAVFMACLTLVTIASADDADKNKTATDTHRIQGTWKVIKKVKQGDTDPGRRGPWLHHLHWQCRLGHRGKRRNQ